MQKSRDDQARLQEIQVFYDDVYYKEASAKAYVSNHLRKLAHTLAIKPGDKVLDVACGLGGWLSACERHGGSPHGVDLSSKAIRVCHQLFPEGEFYNQSAETLPFENDTFNVVSCLGSLEHFLHPDQALREMARVAKSDARILLLVPNSAFLGYRLGLFSGTNQAGVREEPQTLERWEEMFASARLQVESKWRDLHILSWGWIAGKGWKSVPLRLIQAVAVSLLPLNLQYQVYYLCRKTGDAG